MYVKSTSSKTVSHLWLIVQVSPLQRTIHLHFIPSDACWVSCHTWIKWVLLTGLAANSAGNQKLFSWVPSIGELASTHSTPFKWNNNSIRLPSNNSSSVIWHCCQMSQDEDKHVNSWRSPKNVFPFRKKKSKNNNNSGGFGFFFIFGILKK